MCSQLAVDCGAPHAQEDAHLFETHDQLKCPDWRNMGGIEVMHTFQLAHPVIDQSDG